MDHSQNRTRSRGLSSRKDLRELVESRWEPPTVIANSRRPLGQQSPNALTAAGEDNCVLKKGGAMAAPNVEAAVPLPATAEMRDPSVSTASVLATATVPDATNAVDTMVAACPSDLMQLFDLPCTSAASACALGEGHREIQRSSKRTMPNHQTRSAFLKVDENAEYEEMRRKHPATEVVGAMRACRGSRACQRMGCRVLRKLSATGESDVELAGGVAAAVEAMRLHPHAARVQMEAARLLAVVARSAQGARGRVAEAGALKMVALAMRSHLSLPYLRQAALVAQEVAERAATNTGGGDAGAGSGGGGTRSRCREFLAALG